MEIGALWMADVSSSIAELCGRVTSIVFGTSMMPKIIGQGRGAS